MLIALPVVAAVALGSDRLVRPGRAPLSVRGADISFVLQEEAIGRTYRHHGRPRRVEQILADGGATHVRLRVWVDPAPGSSGADEALVLAQRAHDAGLRVVLDLHYSDSWADHTTQTPPAAWAGQSIDQLAGTVADYTQTLLTRFADSGAPVDIVQIGNEITNGLLWPTGFLDGTDESWPRLARLLDSGIAGARASRRGGRGPRVALHVSTGGSRQASETFFEKITHAGVTDFDIAAVSYYPFWNGPLSDLADTLGGLAGRFGKDVLVVETAYPWTLTDPGSGAGVAANIVQTRAQLPERTRHPPTPAGQAGYFDGLRTVLRDVPHGRGLGFLDWEPAWLPGVGATPDGDQSDPYANLTMFDLDGDALPSMDTAFRRPD